MNILLHCLLSDNYINIRSYFRAAKVRIIPITAKVFYTKKRCLSLRRNSNSNQFLLSN